MVYFEELFDTKQDDYGNNKDDTRSIKAGSFTKRNVSESDLDQT